MAFKWLLDYVASVRQHYGSYRRWLKVEGAFVSAAKEGRTADVKSMLDQGDICSGSRGLQAAIQAAAWNGHVNVVKLLLDSDVAIPDAISTALSSAACSGQAGVVKMLLDRGVDPNLTDPHGLTALDYAIRSNQQEIARILRSWRSNSKSV